MKKLVLSASITLVSLLSYAQQTVYVKSYVKSNGTFVQTHFRTAPNHTVWDNWSTYPNVNPYTGEIGTRYYDYLDYPTSMCSNPGIATPVATPSYPINSSFQTNDLMRTNDLFKPAF